MDHNTYFSHPKSQPVVVRTARLLSMAAQKNVSGGNFKGVRLLGLDDTFKLFDWLY